MNDVRVSKQELIEKMRKNRETHKVTYERALVAYEKTVTAKIQAALEERRADKITVPELRQRIFSLIGLDIPENHTNDYDAVLEALEMEQRDEIELAPRDFRAYVRDEWEWKGKFTTTNASYGIR